MKVTIQDVINAHGIVSQCNKAENKLRHKKEKAKQVIALAHEIHGDTWETAHNDFIRTSIHIKETKLREYDKTTYKIIAK